LHRPPLIQRAGAFDLAVCHNSFTHFADEPFALCELARVLASDNCLLILHDLSREQVGAIHIGVYPRPFTPRI
jgi:ubiquinone/menaquinone biosynthesis C-methylase UbiE